MPPLKNRVNSGNNFNREAIIAINENKVNPEPSQKGNFLEGATARRRDYGQEAMSVIPPKSARPERDEIAWTVRRRTEVGFKRPNGNKIDDTLIVKPQDGITSAFFEWREIGGTISISRLEERQNSGEAQILNLLQQKVKQAEMSAKEKINLDLVQGEVSTATFVPITDTTNSSLGLNPLGYFLPKDKTTDPLAGGSVGNINRATYSWWRSRCMPMNTATDTNMDAAYSVTTWQGLKVALYSLYNICSQGADGSAPNLILTNRATFEAYENALDYQKRYMDEGLATMGFDNVKLKGATIVWDEQVPDIDSGTVALTTGTAFFINTNFYKLIIDKQTDFITTPFVEPENQTAKTAKLLFMGNTIMTNPRKMGVAFGISKSLVS
jgi:hypothetical protein